MLRLLGEDLGLFVLSAIAILIAISVHEFAHALVSDRLGDPTPRMQGRLTLNPLRHLDFLGTLLFLLVGFGWGKPVQFDPYNLENPKRDAALISFAGPAANFIVAVIGAILLHFLFLTQPNFYSFSLFKQILLATISYNILLGVFNLVPIHPLDGGKVLIGLLPDDIAVEWDRILAQYGTIILLVLIFPIFGQPLIINIIGPPISFLYHLLLGGLTGFAGGIV